MTLAEAVAEIVANPWTRLVREWNWKSALFSSLIRGGIFFATNATAGVHAATGALMAEVAFGITTSGFYGSLVQVLRKVEPLWKAGLAVGLMMPCILHTLEFAVHWNRGTPKIGLSLFVSVLFTIFSMLFNLYAMRRGVMVVGEGQRPLLQDLSLIPGVIAGFFATGAMLCRKGLAALWKWISAFDHDVLL